MARVRVGRDGKATVIDAGYTPGPTLGQVEVMNMTDAPTVDVYRSVMAVRGEQPEMAMLRDAMSQWHQRTFGNPTRSRAGGLLDRDKYVSPNTYYGKVRTARMALSDDVVGNAADGSETLALKRISMLCEDSDQEDYWTQIALDISFAQHLKQAWRVLFTDSAFVVGIWWGRKNYKVRGKRDQRSARANATLTVPLALTLLDTVKVVPVGEIHFGQETLCYAADLFEAQMFDSILKERDQQVRAMEDQAKLVDWMRDPNASLFMGADMVSRFIVERYEPNDLEVLELQRDGVTDVSNLFRLNPRMVFRHTLTRQPFRRFPDVRLDRVNELLDLKNQLRHSDRTHLIGGANMIILITKGSDKEPGTQEEVDDLRRNAQTLASMPIITSDNRLKVEIITPRLDTTLVRDSHDTLDSRIFASTWQTFVPTGADANDDPIKLGRIIAQGLEGRRSDMAVSYENGLCERIRLLNDDKLDRVRLRFLPRTITLGFDSAMAGYYLDLHEMGAASRETTLGQFDLDQDEEAMLRDRERREYDDKFTPIVPVAGAPAPRQLPAGSDQPDGEQPPAGSTRQATRSGGRRGGGTRGGGGAAPGTNQGGQQSPEQKRRKGRQQRRAANSDIEGDQDDVVDDVDEEDEAP